MGSNPIPSVKSLCTKVSVVFLFLKKSAFFAFIGLAALGLLLFGCQQPQAQGAANFSASNLSLTENNSKGENHLVQPVAKKGDVVSVDYVGTLEDGTVFDTSVKAVAQAAGLPSRPSYAPLSFTVGAGQMIKGFDAAVVGMGVGEEKTIKLPPKEAYGESLPGNVLALPTGELEKMAGEKPEVGMMLSSQTGAQGKIISTNENETTIDFNHELAGKTLVFKITMRKIGA